LQGFYYAFQNSELTNARIAQFTILHSIQHSYLTR